MSIKGISAAGSDERAYNLVQSLNVPKLSVGEMDYDMGKDVKGFLQTRRVDLGGFPRGAWNANNGIAAIADERGYVTLVPFSDKVATALWNSPIPKEETMSVPFTNGLEPAGPGDKMDWQKFATQAIAVLNSERAATPRVAPLSSQMRAMPG